MKKTKKIALIVAVIMLMAVCFAFGVSALDTNGQCGNDVYWDYNSSTKELVISGTGEIDVLAVNQPFARSDIKNLVIENGITAIGDSTFENCRELVNITIPETVTSIGANAFRYCYNLENINIPDSVTKIEDGAFYCCKKLKNVTIGSGVANIGDDVFHECNNIERFEVDVNNPVYSSDENGVLFDKNKTILIKYPVGNRNEYYEVPGTVVTITQKAFYYSLYVKEVALPLGIKTIEDQSFFGCINLEKVVIPGSVENVGNKSFYYCVSLVDIVISEGVGFIGMIAFADNPFLDKIIIEDLDVDLYTYSICANEFNVLALTKEELADVMVRYIKEEISFEEYSSNLEYLDEVLFSGKIYCHSGSTAETYAIENGVDYELTHFFKGEWTYDYENMIRTRKCIHCDELETEELEKIESGDTEIVAPSDPDTDFEVDEIEKNSNDYIIIDEAINNGVDGEYEIVKAFDITMKNKEGVHIQPDGTIKVKLPNDWSKKGVYKVYRVNNDGTLTDMNAYREGSHLVFDTDHFSIYVIVVEGEGVSEEEPETPEIPDGPETPDEPETPAEPDTSDCGCICHKSGWFYEFLTIIFKFVTKITGVFQICDCGIAHY